MELRIGQKVKIKTASAYPAYLRTRTNGLYGIIEETWSHYVRVIFISDDQYKVYEVNCRLDNVVPFTSLTITEDECEII